MAAQLPLTLALSREGDSLRVAFGAAAAPRLATHVVELPPDRLEEIGAACLDAVVRTTRRGRARADAADRLLAAGAALGDAVLTPALKAALAAAPEGSPLRLLLDPATAGVPWEAMVVGEAPLSARLLVGRQVMMPGADDLVHTQPAAADGPVRILIVADPAGDLPHARREGEALAGLLGASGGGCQVTLRAGKLDRSGLLAALRGHDALHFAGHADPPGSDAPPSWRLADGGLTARDIAAMAGGSAGPRLVFAHACRSAGGSEGSDGVLDAFVRAGASHVIGTLWDVPDAKAPDAAAAFWRGLLAGASAGLALQAAREAAGTPAGAAYLLYGDPGVSPMPALRACAACREPAAAQGSRFCDACGAPLPADGTAREERRRVTVVSIGVETDAETGDEEDPETLHSSLNDEYARVSEVIRRYGGTVDRFAGDAVVAVFGAPTAHENDPERAVLAALEVVGAGPPARAGVHTGTAVLGGLGDARRRDHGLAGTVLLQAGKLMRAAAPREVLCGSSTARQVEGSVRLAPAAPPGLPTARKVLGPRAAGERRSTRGLGRRLPLVGRKEELERLQGLLAGVRRDRRPAFATVLGNAGIGKSRLVEEFLEAVRSAPSPPRIAVGQALPFEGGAPYGPVSALLRELLGLSASAQLDDLNSALEDVGEEVPADDLPDWVPRLETSPPSPGGSVDLEALSVVLGLAEPDPRQDAAARRHRVQAAVQRLVEREARKGPIVLVAGDVHWAPDATLDLVEGLGRFLEDVPVMMVTVARPVLLERRPHFGEGRPDHVRLELGPLDEASCRSLVRAVSSDAGGVDDKTVDLAIARSDGNPLFLEELVKDHLERSGEGEEVPETLQAVLAARLDRCGEEERAALRCAAVVGRTFWQGALEAMGAPAGLSEVLASLRARGLLLRRKPPRIRGEEEYLFKHVLMRDVAYARIPREGRAALHRGAAAWLESLPEGSDQFLDARAEHHEQAGDHLRATDLRARAGDRAAAARSDREAQLHYRAAVGLLAQVSPQPEDHDTRRSGILEQLADSLARTGDYDEALAAYSDARSLVPPAFDQGRSADILRREARVHDSRGEFEEALRVLDEASGSMETGRGDVSLWARLASDRGWVQYRLGDLDGADAAYRGALALLGDGDRGEDRAHLHGLLGSLAYTRGELDEAAAQHRDGLALAEELGNSPAIGRCFNNLGIVAERRGDLDEAAEWHARSVRLKAAGGDRPGLALAYNNLGALYWRRGDLAKSAAAFTASLDLKRRLGNRWGEAITLANLAEVLLDSGDHATCAERIAEAERGCEELGNRTLLPELRRLEAELALARGDRAAAAAKATEAASIARELGDATREGAALRVLGEITGDARTLSEALERSTAAGDRAEADRVKAALQAIDAADGPEAP